MQDIKPDNFIKRSKDLSNDQDDERHQHQHQIILKNRNLESGIRPVINLTMIFTDKLEIDMTQLNAILYNLNKEKPANKKSIKKLSLGEVFEESLNRESNEESLK